MIVDQAIGGDQAPERRMGHSPGHRRVGVAARGLGEANTTGLDHWRRGNVGQGDAGEGQPARQQPDRGRFEPAASRHPLGDDLAGLDLDPAVKLVGEPDGVGGKQRLDVRQLIRRRLVVVGDAHAERQAERSLDRGGRYPRQARRGGFVSRQDPSE